VNYIKREGVIMKTLLMLRHAKSDWDDTSLRDFDRPLASRGKRDAPRMGKALKERGPMPDLVISSPATRAKATIEAFIPAAGLELTPQFEDSIYEAHSAELMRIIHNIPDTSNCAIMVGHNPGFENTVSRLTNTATHMPTAALACIELPIDRWEDAEDGQGTLVWLLTPKHLED
jgi:phosphohistidine phosphatase